MKTINNFFKKYNIDHIYCINYIKNNKKYSIESEFNFIGIDYLNNDIFSWEYDYDFNLFNIDNLYINSYNKMIDVINDNNFFKNIIKFKTFKLCLKNYAIMKKSLDLGYNKIMIFEDDIRFLKDKKLIENILDNQDWTSDLLILSPSAQYSKLFSKYDLYNSNKVYSYHKYYVEGIDIKNFDLYSAACNVYSKKMMEIIINLYENHTLFSLDNYYFLSLYGQDKFKITANIYPICIQIGDEDKIKEFNTLNISQYRL